MPDRVVVVGAGLIGSSIGQALTAAGRTVHLRDRVASHARVAESLGAGTLARPVASEVMLVVVAVPPRALPSVIGEALDEFPAATVTDVGSVKAEVLHTLWERGGDLTRYVGSHPMAGSQYSGPLTARADLFHGRTWVVTPHRRSAPASVDVVRDLVELCRARRVEMDVEEHDRAVAAVSHLPHLMSVLMAQQLTTVPDTHLMLAGPGLRDVTRIAAGDPGLWEQILHANTDAVLDGLRGLQKGLATVIGALESHPESGRLHSELSRGVAGTRRIPGKHGSAPTAYGQVVVEIPDTPGALAGLFGVAGAAGVNVEDIAIEHDSVRQVGYLAISVAPEQVPGLAARLREHLGPGAVTSRTDAESHARE